MVRKHVKDDKKAGIKMIEYDELYQEVKKRLSDKRFAHSECVVKRAIEYAEAYHVDVNMVKLVAISHDIAKELTDEEIKEYIEKYKIELDSVEKENPNLVHAKIGAYICKENYGFSEDMCNAIKYHTTGRANMSILEKIIYLADATEESRKYCSDHYVEIIKEDIDMGMIEICKWVINHLLENNRVIHPDSILCYNYYTKLKNNLK